MARQTDLDRFRRYFQDMVDIWNKDVPYQQNRSRVIQQRAKDLQSGGSGGVKHAP